MEPTTQIPPLVLDSIKDLPDVLRRLPADFAAGTSGSLKDTMPAVMRDALDGASVGIVDNQFDALLDALRATAPSGAATDRGGDTYVIEGDVNVDARTKSVEQAWDETIALLRQRSRAGGIPLAGVRAQ